MTAFEYSKVCGPWQNFVGKTWTDEDNLHWWLLYEIKWLAGQEGHVLLFHVNLSNVLESYLPSTCPEFSKLFWVVGSLWLEVTSLSHWLMLLATSCHVALQNALWKLPAGHYVAWFARLEQPERWLPFVPHLVSELSGHSEPGICCRLGSRFQR